MRVTRATSNLAKLIMRSRFTFCKKNSQNKVQQKKQENRFIKFIKDGWRQTFPEDEDQVRRKYEKVKQIKRYTEEEIKQMQDKIPEYTRTALVQTQQKVEQKKSRFKISNLIPESLKQKIVETGSYKQYSEFKQNLKQYVNTSDSAAVNLGTKAYNVVSQPSTAAKATEAMRQYDKQFSLMDLQKQSTFIFKDAYQQFLENNTQGLELLCGDQALDMFKSLLKINAVKVTGYLIQKVRPKYTQILHHNNSSLKKTVASQNSLPSFLFDITIMELYCMIDGQGKIVDGDDERVMSSTFQFVLKYSGVHIAQLGHPWQIIQFRKIDEIPIRKKVRNYPKDFTPPSGYLTPRVQQKSQQKSSTSPYTHINNKSCKGHIINLNQSTQLIENLKESTKNILFTINPQQNSRSHLSDVEKQSPLINQHLGRKMHYINPDLLKRPRIQQNSGQQLVQIQQDEAQNSTPGSIRKNLPSQKPLSEQQPNYIHVPSKNIFSSNKLQVNDNEFYQSLKSQYINVSNLKNKKILSFNKSFQNEPSNSFRLGKRNSDTQLIQSHLQTTKEKSEQKKNFLDFGYLLEQKRVDKLKAHINQIAYDKVRNKQRIVSSNETQADQANRFSYTQRKRPNSNFIQNNHEAYPELNGQSFQRRSSRIGGDSNVIERFDTQKQSKMRALSSLKQSFNMRGSKKITISYKKTSLNQLKKTFSSLAKTQSAEIQISVPNILMNIKFDRNIQKHELYAQSTNLFQCLGLPIQNITVKRYSNCILIVSKNVCILWHYDGKVYLGGWQVQYLDQGCKHGLGLQWVPNRHVYYGQFVQSKKQGLGVMKTNDQVYFGEWQKGKKTDNGFSICKNGQVTAQNNEFHRVSNINTEYNGFETDPFL